MNVVEMNPAELIPYQKNAKQHTPTQVEKIANSIKRFGWQQPIVVDRNKVVIIGHGRLAAAKHLNLEKVPVVFAEDLSEEDVKALRLADNKLNESDWIGDRLAEELAELDIAGIDMRDFGFEFESENEKENPYTQKTDIPQYQIQGEDVTPMDLYRDVKTKELLEEIEEAEIGKEAKEFLRLAAYRHVIFNYQKIAEYYAKADKTVQELMERSALVIIDINDAIRNGYTHLRKTIDDIMLEDMDYD